MFPGDNPEQRIAELESELAAQKRINSRRQSNGLALRGMNLFGAVAGFIGLCAGGGSALIAMFPTSALWMSAIICGAPNQLMVNTANYSYKPNQSGTTVDFECLKADGVYEASWLAISALQGVLVAVVLAGVLAVALAIRRKTRNEAVSPAMTATAGGLGVLAAAAVAFFASQAFSGASYATQLPEGGSLTVEGREMTVNITGHCASLSVDGVIHHVTVDSVDSIDVDGIHNVVIYHSGSPKITKQNPANTVQQNEKQTERSSHAD